MRLWLQRSKLFCYFFSVENKRGEGGGGGEGDGSEASQSSRLGPSEVCRILFFLGGRGLATVLYFFLFFLYVTVPTISLRFRLPLFLFSHWGLAGRRTSETGVDGRPADRTALTTTTQQGKDQGLKGRKPCNECIVLPLASIPASDGG